MTSENNTEILTLSDQPSKVNTLSATEDCIELMTRAYAKVILHAAKYPHTAVNGVLLAKLPAKGGLIIRGVFIILHIFKGKASNKDQTIQTII